MLFWLIFSRHKLIFRYSSSSVSSGTTVTTLGLQLCHFPIVVHAKKNESVHHKATATGAPSPSASLSEGRGAHFVKSFMIISHNPPHFSDNVSPRPAWRLFALIVPIRRTFATHNRLFQAPLHRGTGFQPVKNTAKMAVPQGKTKKHQSHTVQLPQQNFFSTIKHKFLI